jgi:hypothetical protein
MRHPVKPKLVKRTRVAIADRWLCRDPVCQMRLPSYSPELRLLLIWRKPYHLLPNQKLLPLLTVAESLNVCNRPLRFR